MWSVTTTLPARHASRWQMPRIDPDDRWVGGVGAAIARELGVQPIVIRLAFVVLALGGGWGLVAYAVAWLVLAVAQPRRLAPYHPEPKAASPFHLYLAVAMIVLGLVLALRPVAFFIDEIVFPVTFVVTGFLIAWTRHRSDDGLSAVVRILVGVGVGVGGIIAFFLVSTDLGDALLLLVIGLTTMAGIGLVAAPSLARIGQDLDDERQNRVRADERARVAAHLHDSVLQTLALIQRHADDPAKTAQLARRQERELRSWLYGSTADPPAVGTVRLGSALEEMAAEIDDAHGVPVKVITVGDHADLGPRAIDAIVAATREAAVNAARHSGTKQVDVYAERHDDRIEIFVRDTGVGFDPDQTAADRRGVAESIVGRMARAGGSAAIHSTPGEGTEVELVLPVEPTSADGVGTAEPHGPEGATGVERDATVRAEGRP